MPFDSTAPNIFGDEESSLSGGEEFRAERIRVISDQQKSSANLHDPEFDTSGNVARENRVLRRREPPIPTKKDRFMVLKNWEGVVTAVERETFFASMRQTNSNDRIAEDGIEIDIDNVPAGDHELVRVGAVFYLTVGISYPRGERQQKTTQLIFRRMPRWSSQDIVRAEKSTDDLWDKLHSDLTENRAEPPSETQ